MGENSALTKSRWTTLWVSCIINVVIGTGYAWSVFGAAWAEKLGIGAGQAALAFTVCNAVGPITMITGGKINDALGPKWVIFIGGLMFGGGIFVAGFASSLSWIIIWYGVVFGLGMGLVYSCTIGNTVKFFPDRRGFVGGITTMAYGLGSVILAPIAQKMVAQDSFGVATTFKILGVIYLVVICVGAFMVKKCPDGFLPDGYVPPAPAANTKAVTDKTWSEMLKDPIFYVMFLMLVAGAFFGLMMISQCATIAKVSMDMAASAAIVVTVLALFNALGRVGCGTISDKLGRINTLIMCLCIAIVGLLLMLFAGENKALFVVGICCVGFGFGAFMGVYPGFTADQFGAKNNGVNYGIMFIAFAAAGVLGPMIMNATKEVTEYAPDGITVVSANYATPYKIAIAIAVVGLVLAFCYKKMSKSK